LAFRQITGGKTMRHRKLLASLMAGTAAAMIAGPLYAFPIEIELEVVADGLTSPVFLTHAGDASGRLFIVDQAGQIRVVDQTGTLLPAPFLDLTAKIPALNAFFDERGVLGLAFHPDYASNGRFFVRYSSPRAGDPLEPCNDPGGFVVGCHEAILAEYSVLGDPLTSNVADPSSEIILFRIDEPQFNHNAGQVMFGPDGLLYWTLGDGGGAHDGLADIPPSHGPDGHGQNTFTALGSVLRIDVDGPPDPGLDYAIPPGNPFADGVNGAPEIYAYGLRNPYRFSFDDGPGGDGSLYVADVGQNLFEEVDVVPLEEAPGLLNYGWVIREGLHCFDPFNPTVPPATCSDIGPFGEPLLDPVLEYDHTDGIAVVGGFVYRGSANPLLFNNAQQFVVPSGRLFYTSIGEPPPFELNEFVLAPNGDPLGEFVFGFGEDEDGELYVLASGNLGPIGDAGVVYRIINARFAKPIPTVSGWGLLVMTLLLLAGIVISFGRRRTPAPG
jgi:glucose/arabinose dehydrogenase